MYGSYLREPLERKTERKENPYWINAPLECALSQTATAIRPDKNMLILSRFIEYHLTKSHQGVDDDMYRLGHMSLSR